MINKIRRGISIFFNFLWSLFINGLSTILPITLTIALFNVSFRLLTSWLEPLRKFAPTFLVDIPYAEIIVVIGIILTIGAILKIFVLHPLINAIESILFKIPLFKPIYTGIKQLLQALSSQETVTFKKVVLIEFPRIGTYSIGFLTSEIPPELSPNHEHKYFSIFIPTTPNPTSGYFIIVPEREITILNITRQEAMALIISGGIIQPEHLK